MKKVLITGGAGFIGSHIVEEFINDGEYKIIVVDNLSSGKIENIDLDKIDFYKVDIREEEKLEEIFQKYQPIDYVIHEAAQVSVGASVKDPKHDADQNIMGLLNVLNLCKKYKVKKMLFASSAAVYGVPKKLPVKETDETRALSFYGLTKLTGEQYIRLYSDLYGLKYVIFRYANVYGERQDAQGEAGVVAIFSQKMLVGDSIYIEGDGHQTRDFIYVRDVARANYLAVKESIENQTLNVGTNSETSINKLAEIMKLKSGYSGEILYKEPRNGDIKNSRLDNTHFIGNTSWDIRYTLEEGMRSFFKKSKSI